LKTNFEKMTAKEIVTNYWLAWNEHNLDKLLGLLAPEFISRSSLSHGRPAGKDRIALGFKMFDKAFPDLKEEIVSMIADGDRVACEVIETATFTGDMSLPAGVLGPNHRSYSIAVSSFFQINEKGLIAAQRTYWDTADWEQQIGIDPKIFVPKNDHNQ
jgi:steroid delta-isomerase-like uncharacterized protein